MMIIVFLLTGIAQIKDIDKNGRIYGEIAYFRRWSESKSKPETDITMNDDSFNNLYSGDIIYIPRGVEDLYYLDTEKIGIDTDKIYLIDATNSMIYTLKGHSMKNVSVHSLAMYKELTGGNATVNFANAEVAGGGDNVKYAGEKYLKDKNGNYIDENGNIVGEENKVENPYGFELYTDYRSNNIYKLYNNGELYGKGIKGTGLNTSEEEMSEINASKFSEFTIPAEVKDCKKIITGANTVFFIDKDDYLWALGSNTSNKLGLTSEQQVEYTGRDVVKLNIDNKKVDMCWDLDGFIYVRTKDNLLYSMGGNLNQRNSYILGTGNTDELKKFTQVNFDKTEKIDYFVKAYHGSGHYRLIVACSDNTYYALGYNASELCGAGTKKETYKLFTPIFNGWSYTYDSENNKYVQDQYDEDADIDEEIKKLCREWWCVNILKNDGTFWHAEKNKITQFKGDVSSNVKDIFNSDGGYLCVKDDNTVWGISVEIDPAGLGGLTTDIPMNVKLPDELISSGIKEIYSRGDTIYYLSNDGIVYGSSSNITYLNTAINENKVIKIPNTPIMESFYDHLGNNVNFMGNVVICKGVDGKLYAIGISNIIFRNSILEMNWKKITDLKVEKVVVGEHNSLAVIDKNGDLYVCGEDARLLGLDIATPSKVSNLTKIDSKIINGNVLDVSFTDGTMTVLLKNGELYASGIYSSNGRRVWPYEMCPGWKENENYYTLKKIEIPNVSLIASVEKEHIALAEGKIFTWGENYYNSYYEKSIIPKLSKFNEIVKGENIKKMFISKPATMVLLDDGSIYIDGGEQGASKGYSGVGLGNAKLEDMSSSFQNKEVIEFSSGFKSAMFLTDDGSPYGYGYERTLGINSSSDVIVDKIQKLPIGENNTEVTQVLVGKDNAFAVTKDGKVFGTGDNSYGALGRWIGVDRASPNSRYKTAFEWVECPELEL